MSYEFIANTGRSSTGHEGMRFFPFVVFAVHVRAGRQSGRAHPLFIHRYEPVDHHGVVRAARVFHCGRLRLLEERPALPQSVRSKGGAEINPWAIVAIEVLSFLSRPVSHSVRLFANMLAGHITLQVFAGFVIMLGSAGILGVFGATLPFIMVAFLQAYVFANDAIHPGH
jgi:F-type H+-transporting ATPase subunit a